MRNTTIFASLLLGLCAWTAVSAAPPKEPSEPVYRYTDSKGVVHYTDEPPTKDAKPANLPKLHTFPSGKPPENFNSDAAGPAPKFSLSIDSPTAEQTIREAGASIPVSVSVLPGLVGGYGLLYTIDGQAVNDAPVFSTSMTIPPQDRGSHVIGVSLVDAKRRPQAQASVNVHIKPPTAK